MALVQSWGVTPVPAADKLVLSGVGGAASGDVSKEKGGITLSFGICCVFPISPMCFHYPGTFTRLCSHCAWPNPGVPPASSHSAFSVDTAAATRCDFVPTKTRKGFGVAEEEGRSNTRQLSTMLLCLFTDGWWLLSQEQLSAPG